MAEGFLNLLPSLKPALQKAKRNLLHGPLSKGGYRIVGFAPLHKDKKTGEVWPDLLMDIKQIVKTSHYSRMQVFTFMKKGCPYLRIGGKTYFFFQEFLDWLDQAEQQEIVRGPK